MKVGIIGAMEQEVTFLIKKINNLQMLKLAGCEIYIGMLNGIETTLLKCGIGKTAAAIGTTIMFTLYKPDLVINIGSAGSLVSTLKIGDIVLSSEVSYYDADLTVFGYKPGQIAGCPAAFCADKKLIFSTEKVIEQFNINAIQGLIVTGDTFVNGAELLARICQIFPNAIAVEMEAAAIGHVCYKFNIPFVVIRAITDIVNQTSNLSFNTFLDTAAIQSSLVVENLLLQLINI